MTFEVLAGTILSIMNKVNDTVTEDEIVEQLEKNGISTDCHMKFVREICKHALDVRNNDRCTKDLLCAYLSKTRPTGAGGMPLFQLGDCFDTDKKEGEYNEDDRKDEDAEIDYEDYSHSDEYARSYTSSDDEQVEMRKVFEPSRIHYGPP